MFDRNKQKVRKISQLLMGFCVVVFFTWFVAAQFGEASQKGKDAAKKFELRQLEKSLALYELTYGSYPTSADFPHWCEVGKRYEKKLCLFELTRDGFMGALPVSPDANQYMYIAQGRTAFVAVGFDDVSQIPADKQCEIEGVKVWCLEVIKL